MFLDFLSEVLPYFRTEKCAFVFDEGEESMTCLGRLVDLDDDEDFDATMDISSLGCFVTYKAETFKDYRYSDSVNTEGENDE